MPPGIRLAHDQAYNRIAALENEVDVLRGRPPRNKYTCISCYGTGTIDESYHGSPDFRKCQTCDGGRLVREANERLMKGEG